ncbi:putative holin [Edaphovirga cremea]|uniref:putative holin n=1 Tax=Edaphovirga cremea TaxID=2267246 RepID=UPI000DEF8266|nr:putative holin [Edaphovirga cremea]
MGEPVSTGTGAATYILGGVTIIGLAPGINSGIVIGAFGGAVIYVLSSADISILRRVCLFLISFLVGIVSADFVTSIINYFTPDVIVAEAPLGAVVASAVAVRLLMFISKESGDPVKLIKKLRGHGDGGK